MNLNTLYARAGDPFPAGGRIAARVDLDAVGIEPVYRRSPLADLDAHKSGQPSNRGLLVVRVINPLNGI
jgi:hypothetical protein